MIVLIIYNCFVVSKNQSSDTSNTEKIKFNGDFTSNHPYNYFTNYIDGYTYVCTKKEIYRVANVSSTKESLLVIDSEGAIFKIHNEAIYAMV